MINIEFEPSPNWWLTNITEEQYRTIYAGTPAMNIVHLFREPPKSDADYITNYFPSKLVRLNSGIYTIEDKKGIKRGFEMNYAQHFVYAASLRHPRIIVLKSRQQGISTLWLLSFIDDAITMESMSIGLMSQGKAESKTLFQRTRVALENLPSNLVKVLGVQVIKDNSEAISFSNGSKMYIQTSFRSGTLQRLHISEMGKISAKYPEKARETKAGSLQAIAPGNTVVVESTAEGRKNEFYKMWYEAYDFVGTRTPMDFAPVFLSWVDDPDCAIDVPQRIDKEAEDYFIKCEREVSKLKGEEITLTDRQKWWWVAKKRELPEDIFQEYPATPDEAFAAVRDGAYYARHYTNHIKDKQEAWCDGDEVVIGGVKRRGGCNHGYALWDPKLPVYASCDLGRNDMWVTTYFQVHADLDGRREWRIIGEYHNSGEDISHYVNESKSRPWLVEKWYLPHDAAVTDLSQSKSRADIFRALGCRVRVLAKTTSVVNDIEVVRANIPQMWFDRDQCEYLIEAMYSYSKEWDAKLGAWKPTPLHDEWSNAADSLRYMVMGYDGGVGIAVRNPVNGGKRRKSVRRGGKIAI